MQSAICSKRRHSLSIAAGSLKISSESAGRLAGAIPASAAIAPLAAPTGEAAFSNAVTGVKRVTALIGMAEVTGRLISDNS